MDNFDLRKYLVENKVTTNSRMLTEASTDYESTAKNSFPELVEKYGLQAIVDALKLRDANAEKASTDPFNILFSLPDYAEKYLKEHGLEDYYDRDEDGNASDVLAELGIALQDVYKSIPTGQDNGAEKYLYYDLGDGFVLGTEDYTRSGPGIYKKADFDNVIQQFPELGAY